MICEEALALMSAKLDGALSPDEEAELRAHLAACPDCRALMETLEGLDEKLADLREPAPEGLKKGVLYRIDQATGKAKPARRRWFGPGTALGAVAAVLVLLVGLKVIPLSLPDKATQAAGSQESRWAEAKEGQMDDPGTAGGAQYGLPAPSLELKGSADGAEYINDYFGCTEPAEGIADGYVLETGCPAETDAIEVESEPNGVTLAPEVAAPTKDFEYVELAKAENAAVLVYTEFDPASLFALLKEEEPQLYALVAELEPEYVGGTVRYATDCGTVLAIHEWLLSQLPREEEMEPAVEEAETRLMIRMEAIDPGSENLNRIITWAPKDHPIAWPDAWPEGWADRIRLEENWQLYFPTEDFVPNADKSAYLVFYEN